MIDRKILLIGIAAIIIVVLGVTVSMLMTPPSPRNLPEVFTVQKENGAVLLTYTGKDVLNRSSLKLYVNRGSGLSDETSAGEVKGSVSWDAVHPGDTFVLPARAGYPEPLEVLVMIEPAVSGRPEENIPRFISKSFLSGEQTPESVSPVPARTFNGMSLSGPLVPDFISRNTSPYAPQIVQFNDTSEGAPSAWLWNFGDGSASSLRDPIHVYQNFGNYTVALTIYNGTADTSVIRENAVVVLERQSLTADLAKVFPVAPQIADNGDGTYTAYFGYNNENSIPVSIPPGDLNSFSPEPSNRGQPTVFEPGIHTDAVAIVFDGNSLTWNINNQKATASRYSPHRSEPPVADFFGYPVSGSVPLRVAFSDTSRGSPASWEWTFGDGSRSDEQNPLHIYTSPGNYTVTLTVKNIFGTHRSGKTDYISVIPKPPEGQ